MKKLLFTLVSCAMTLGCFAQANKPVVTVEKFTGKNEAFVQLLRAKVISGVQAADRVNVVDVGNETQLNAEIERRKSELAMNDVGRVGDVSTLMSNGILKGSLDNMTTTRKEQVNREGKKEVYFSTEIAYTLTLINAENGTTIKQQNFTNSGSGATDKLSIDAALSVQNGPIKRFILNAYPVNGKIIEIDEADAKKAKKVYVNLGSADGLSKGQKLEVFKEKMVGGSASKKLIGEITVEEISGDNVSLCKVGKGGDVILTEMNAGSTLPVKTKEQKASLFGSMFED